MSAKLVLNSLLVVALITIMLCTKHGETEISYCGDRDEAASANKTVYAERSTKSYFDCDVYDIVTVDSDGKAECFIPNVQLIAVCDNGDLIVRNSMFDLMIPDEYFLYRLYVLALPDPSDCNWELVSRIRPESGEVIWKTDMSKYGRYDRNGIILNGSDSDEPISWDDIGAEKEG